MGSLNEHIMEYSSQLRKGRIQKAYKGIMSFMSDTKVYLEKAHSEYSSSSLYFGYMDMTYFAFTPPALKEMKLKIAVVFLHEECRFELWLAGINRKVRSDYIEFLSTKDIGKYKLSQASPGMDSIIASIVVEQPDFDNPEKLKEANRSRGHSICRRYDLYPEGGLQGMKSMTIKMAGSRRHVRMKISSVSIIQRLKRCFLFFEQQFTYSPDCSKMNTNNIVVQFCSYSFEKGSDLTCYSHSKAF